MDKLFLTVEIEVNSACNKACSYCPNSQHRRAEQGQMEEWVFRLLLQQLAEMNFQGALHYHFYNEPLLCTRLEEYVSLSKEILPLTKSRIFTNGTLLTRERFDALVKAGVDQFIVTHHERSENFIFDQVYKELDEASRQRVKYEGYEKLIFSNRGGLVEAGRYRDQLPLRKPCYIPMSSVVVTLKGNILTCYEDFYQKKEMGNITKQHLKDIWDAQEYRQFREALKKGERSKYEVCAACNNIKVLI